MALNALARLINELYRGMFMKKFLVLFSALVLSVSVMACDSGSSSTGETTGGETTGETTGEETSGEEGGEVEPTTVTISDWTTGDALEGVSICINVEGYDCVATDADGVASFDGDLAIGTEVQMTGDLEGYFPFLVEFTVTDQTAGSSSTYVMAPNEIVGVVAQSVGEEPLDDKGHLTVVAWGPADDEGVRYGVVGATVTVTGEYSSGPKYYNLIEDLGDGVFGPDEDGTTGAGMAGYFNVAPGTVSFVVTAEGHDCTTPFNGFVADDGQITASINEARLTYASVLCELN